MYAWEIDREIECDRRTDRQNQRETDRKRRAKDTQKDRKPRCKEKCAPLDICNIPDCCSQNCVCSFLILYCQCSEMACDMRGGGHASVLFDSRLLRFAGKRVNRSKTRNDIKNVRRLFLLEDKSALFSQVFLCYSSYHVFYLYSLIQQRL